jgi:hypothetical protein
MFSYVRGGCGNMTHAVVACCRMQLVQCLRLLQVLTAPLFKMIVLLERVFY